MTVEGWKQMKNFEAKWRHFILGGGLKSVILFEGSQAMHARPSDKHKIKIKTSG